MQHTEGRFNGTGGIELYHQKWEPDEPAAAVVVLVHGVGEHSGRYPYLVGPLVEAGYAVYGYDHRGHGRSGGRRVHVDRWSEYRDDLKTFLGVVAREQPSSPVVIYGHSMGSLVVLDYLLHSTEGLSAAVISGVALEPVGVGSPALIALARVLTHVTPRLAIPLGIESSSLTRDPEALAALDADDLMEPKATVRWGTESLDTVASIKSGMDTIDIPVLVVHGGGDPLNAPSGARALYEALPNPEKQLRIYPDVRHEPHNDLGHEQLAADVRQWLDEQLGTAR